MEVRRAEDAYITRGEGVLTRHAFSFGEHFDPANTRFGALVAHNEERIAPGRGYDTHHHAGLEIVSRVLTGELTHADSTGHQAVIRPGTFQHLTAGTGVDHSERNESNEPLVLLQLWLLAEDRDAAPSYRQQHGDELRVGRSTLRAHRLAAGQVLRLPEASWVHASVTRGSLDLVGTGGTVRSTGGGELLTATEPTEILVWTMEDEMHDAEVTDAPERSRYEATQDGEVVGFAAYSRQGDVVVLPHVEVDPAHQGRGLAGRLVQLAMDDARAAGLSVMPICPYAVRWIGEHPEYQDLDARAAS